VADSRAAESGAVETQNHLEAASSAPVLTVPLSPGMVAPSDPDLALLIAIWPTLPIDVRAGIVTIVRTASNYG
jgi:hypothetical protein